MTRRQIAISVALLLCALAAVPESLRADTPDAPSNFALSDPASGKTGTARAMAKAVISANMVIEYVSPMNLGLSEMPDKTQTLRLIASSGKHERDTGNRVAPPLAASLSVQGMPNQTFAISIDQAKSDHGGQGGFVLATFSHSAGPTPHIGPTGDTQFSIGAALRLPNNAAGRGYSGTLDVIVSHN